MVHKFSAKADRIYAEEDGVPFFDTDAYPVQFAPTADEVLISGKTVTFPDLVKGNAYAYAAGAIGSNVYASCQSYITLAPQNWGPVAAGESTPTNELADEVIGTVPGDTDIILVYVKATRTSTPSQINSKTIPVMFKEGEWVYAPGGSLLLEYLPPMNRVAHILLAEELNVDGTRNIILRRKQSVERRRYTYWRAGNDPQNSGWTYGGAAGAYGHIVYAVDAKGPTFDPSGSMHERGSASQCSLTDPTDYGSEYEFDIRVVPGRSNISPTDVEGVLFVPATTMERSEASSSTHTFADMPLGPEHPTRRLFVAVAAYRSGSAPNISGVTVAGVAATQVVVRRTPQPDRVVIAAIYSAVVPTGEDDDVVVSFTGAVDWCNARVFAGYNMVSGSAVDTVSSANTQTNQSLTTAPDGYAMVVGVGNPVWTLVVSNGWTTPEDVGVQGMENAGMQPGAEGSGVTVSWAFQKTTGATINTRVKGSDANGDYSDWTAWVAASFH